MKKKTNLHFRRIELKYMIPTRKADLIIPTLASYLDPDPYAHKDGFYTINSVYFDSNDLLCYNQKLDGILFRKKFRLRYYNSNKTNFFEIKRKVGDTVIKDRAVVNLPQTDFGVLTMGEILSRIRSSDFKAELASDSYRLHLKPTAMVTYRRMPFVSKHSRNLRITLDYNLQASKITQRTDHGKGKAFVNSSFSVFEIKFNGSLPAWLASVIKTHNLQRTEFSKYAQAIEILKINQ